MYTTNLALAQQALRQEDKHHIESLACKLGLHYATMDPVPMEYVSTPRPLTARHEPVTVEEIILAWLGVETATPSKLRSIGISYWEALRWAVSAAATPGISTQRAQLLQFAPTLMHRSDPAKMRALIKDCTMDMNTSGLHPSAQCTLDNWSIRRLAEMALTLGDPGDTPDLAKLVALGGVMKARGVIQREQRKLLFTMKMHAQGGNAVKVTA